MLSGTFQAAIENGIEQNLDITNSIHWYFLIPVTQRKSRKNISIGKDTSFSKYQIATIKHCREQHKMKLSLSLMPRPRDTCFWPALWFPFQVQHSLLHCIYSYTGQEEEATASHPANICYSNCKDNSVFIGLDTSIYIAQSLIW